MKILITGGSGLLGQYLNIQLSKVNEIVTTYNSNAGNCNSYNSLRIDLTDSIALKKLFSSYKPDVVIHTAAISRPETCDKLPMNFVQSVNIKSTIEIAELCELHKSKLIYTSTDLVYDGDQGPMLKEDAKLKPVSLYAESKLQSEVGIINTFDNYIILRTSLLYGIGLNHSTNNFHSLLINLKKNYTSKLFYDQFRTPLSLTDAAQLIGKLTDPDLKSITLNFGGKERVSRVMLGEVLCEAGNFDKPLIEKISLHDIPGIHKVEDVSLKTDLMHSLGLTPKSINESICEILNQTHDLIE